MHAELHQAGALVRTTMQPGLCGHGCQAPTCKQHCPRRDFACGFPSVCHHCSVTDARHVDTHESASFTSNRPCWLSSALPSLPAASCSPAELGEVTSSVMKPSSVCACRTGSQNKFQFKQ